MTRFSRTVHIIFGFFLYVLCHVMFDHVIQEYKIFVNDDLVGMTTDNIFAVEGLAADTIYVVMVTSYSRGEEGDAAIIRVSTPPTINKSQLLSS